MIQEEIDTLKDEIDDLKEENERLVQALKWLADEVTDLFILQNGIREDLEQQQLVREDRAEALRRLLEG